MSSLNNKAEKFKLFKMALIFFGMSRADFASSVGTKGVSQKAVEMWFTDRLNSRNIENAVNTYLEKFRQDVLNQFSNAA